MQDDSKENNAGALFDKLRQANTTETSPPLPQDISPDADIAITSLGEDTSNADVHTAPENLAMPPEAKRALVYLLRHGLILAAQKSKLFEALSLHQNKIRPHLANMYLQLVLDEKTGLAFVENQKQEVLEDEDEEESFTLISRRTLSLYDTLLLLVLRKYYQERESLGEQKIIIDAERIETNLSPFLPLTNSTKSDRTKLKRALTNMLTRKIITLVRGSQDRFEITPIIRYIVSAEFLESLLQEYIKLAESHGIHQDEQGEAHA